MPPASALCLQPGQHVRELEAEGCPLLPPAPCHTCEEMPSALLFVGPWCWCPQGWGWIPRVVGQQGLHPCCLQWRSYGLGQLLCPMPGGIASSFPLEAAAPLQSHLQDADQVFLLKNHPEALQGAQAGKASVVLLSRAKLFQSHDKQISAQAASRSNPV